MGAKEEVLHEIRRRIHHHESLSSADIRVKDGDGREVVFELVDCNKYTLRDEFIDGFQAQVDDHVVALVIETFTSSRVTAVLVDTTAHADTVEQFIYERDNAVTPSLEDYDSLTLAHVEALESWGAVNRLHQLDAKHIHDAFIEYHRTEADTVDLTC